MRSALDVLAGPAALSELRDGGLKPDRVRILVGASGGPKWLALYGLDRVLFPWLLEGARAPVHAVSSSIGSFRFAALCTREPSEALARFAESYVEQRYSARPSAREVSAEAERILDGLLGADGVQPLLDHARIRLHVVTTRFRHLGASEGSLQLAGLAAAALANLAHRRALALSVERVLFDAAGDPGPFAPWDTLPTRHVALNAENARAALLASASIPRVMAGIRDPLGAPRGTYRDGGVADYHFGPRIDPDDGIALYPHFYRHLVPGWFDKAMPWRRVRGLRRVVLLAPSAEHVAALPHGRIPDRGDFKRMDDHTRIKAWRSVVALSERLGEEFGELVASGRIGERARPLD